MLQLTPASVKTLLAFQMCRTEMSVVPPQHHKILHLPPLEWPQQSAAPTASSYLTCVNMGDTFVLPTDMHTLPVAASLVGAASNSSHIRFSVMLGD